MRILLISAEVWRHDTNGGNVLSNIFTGLNAEFAQIYCSSGMPSNNLCKKYFQITDAMVIKNILKKGRVGRAIEFQNYPNDSIEKNITEKGSESFHSFFKKYNFQIFYVMKELIWKWSDWKNDDLEMFVKDFNPDIIFAPCYGSHIMLSIDRHIAKMTNKPMISYISDDHYSLRYFSLSPFFWINRFALRKNLRKTFPYYSLTYTMTDEQLSEYTKALNCKMRILRKGVDVSVIPYKKTVNLPLKLIYAGGVYAGRSQTLQEIVYALEKINKNGVKVTLDIYTGTELTGKEINVLNDRQNSFVNGLVTTDELKLKYQESDIALHVESFEIKYRLLTRLSFSTKIVDCLSSGCAVMAICWKEHSGYIYLEKEDAAICVDNVNDIYDNLVRLVENLNLVKEYAEKAYVTCEKDHAQQDIRNMLESDFKAV
jgi:hypothetical protein